VNAERQETSVDAADGRPASVTASQSATTALPASGTSAHTDAAAHARALSRLRSVDRSQAFVRRIGRAYGNRHLGRVLKLARVDLLSGTHAATQPQHAQVEAVLHPGSTVVVIPPVSSGAPPTVTVQGPPAMTGGGVGGPFERDMVTALRGAVRGWAGVLRARRAAGPPAFPMAQANDIARAAQETVEQAFGPLIQAASRETADLYHPGTFNLASVLGDQSSRALNDASRMGWTHYWMTLNGVGQQVLNRYHVLEDRDTAEFNRVLQVYALNPANRSDIDDAIHSWPAEAGTATVYIQPYADPAASAQRTNRWDLFTTLLHEMMHKVAHPNFERTAQAVGGTAQKYLTEGFADLMRHDVLWDGVGQLRARLATPAMAPLRLRVEGATYPYDASAIVYHSDYSEIAQARMIAAQVGLENCKVAFFLGRTELLGIGAGTGTTTSLAGIAGWTPSDAADSEIYVVQAGDSLPFIASKTGVAAGAITQENGLPLPSGWAPTVGARLRAPGIRYTRSVRGDTLESLARQNGVTAAAVATANGFPSASPGSTAVAAGRRILIPAHP
jgi:LysM repeat protein